MNLSVQNLFSALSLIPIKVFQAAEIIAMLAKNAGFGKKPMVQHPLYKEGGKGLPIHLPSDQAFMHYFNEWVCQAKHQGFRN
jgi:hypothetical protein